MATVTRRIGLSLGADICWPQCYEDLVADLDLALPIGGDTVRFAVDRVTIEPFNLRQSVPYDVVLDRLTHWYHPSREWIKKAILMDGVYVLNNPWSVQSMQKQTTYCAMMHLGMPVPETILVPPKAYDDLPDLEPTLQRYARLFDLGDLGKRLGYPLFMKPFDGGGWVGVNKVDDEVGLREAYEQSGKFVMHLQQGILPYDKFVRCIGFGPQTRIVDYDPSQPLHDRYRTEPATIDDDDAQLIRDTTLTINAFFGWDFNSCELILKDGVWHPFDFANPCPDSQVTSLHAHFPWLIIAKLRWSLFCAAHKIPFQMNLDWAPFYEVRERDLPYREKLREYARIAARRLHTEQFEEFCATHLGHLEEVVREYFGDDRAHAAVRRKVEALYPEHEWDEFTELFWGRIQEWRRAGPTEAPR